MDKNFTRYAYENSGFFIHHKGTRHVIYSSIYRDGHIDWGSYINLTKHEALLMAQEDIQLSIRKLILEENNG